MLPCPPFFFFFFFRLQIEDSEISFSYSNTGNIVPMWKEIGFLAVSSLSHPTPCVILDVSNMFQNVNKHWFMKLLTDLHIVIVWKLEYAYVNREERRQLFLMFGVFHWCNSFPKQ